MINDDIYTFVLSSFLSDNEHISICCTNKYRYHNWSKHVKLNNKYNEQVVNNTSGCPFIKQIQHLHFSHDFNQRLRTKLMNLLALKTIIFGKCYNQLTSAYILSKGTKFAGAYLGPTITHLTFGDRYNQPTNYIPSASSYHLNPGCSYSKPPASKAIKKPPIQNTTACRSSKRVD